MGLLANWDALQGDPARLGWTADLLDWGNVVSFTPMLSVEEVMLSDRKMPPVSD